ncbi:MAG: hypothetical protein ABIX37_11425, partial [Gammaproteobacteria bacterium]
MLLVAAGLFTHQSCSAADALARFELDLAAGASVTPARIVIRQGAGALREIVLDADRVLDASGDGKITTVADEVRWRPPATGGTLRYQVALSHRRNGTHAAGNDALVAEHYALFRGEDAFPVRAWRRARGSTLEGELAIRVPRQWSLVTPYLPNALGPLPISNPGERLPRPIGWIAAGDLGTRRDVIAGIEITVTAPRGLRLERVAMLGLLRWTLPRLVPTLTETIGSGVSARPRYVSIVSAGDPMWLGALSAPNSLFVH